MRPGAITGRRKYRPTIRYVTSIEDELRDRDRGEVGLQYLRIDYVHIPPLRTGTRSYEIQFSASETFMHVFG
jgi:hypothetical protein